MLITLEEAARKTGLTPKEVEKAMKKFKPRAVLYEEINQTKQYEAETVYARLRRYAEEKVQPWEWASMQAEYQLAKLKGD